MSIRRTTTRGLEPRGSTVFGACLRFASGARSRRRFGFDSAVTRAGQVKQGKDISKGVAARVPGTTKVVYTNEKGREFTFAIPVAELTHPPVLRQSPAAGGWREIDTSFCDTGELEDDMPTAAAELMRRAVRHTDEGAVVSLTGAELSALAESFRALCEEYVLLDTRGMKSSSTPAELNSGPDYEMYDRKLMRRRFWLTIRHQHEAVRELLWPSSLLDAAAAGAEGDHAPTLTAREMLRALVWLEAASTFCVTAHHAYDLAPSADFTPIDLQREVRVLAARARGTGFLDSAVGGADDFISCASLCAKHGVPFGSFFASAVCAEAGSEAALLLASAPAVAKVKDAVRLMGAVNAAAAAAGCTLALTGADGRLDAALGAGVGRLCGPHVFGSVDCLENADEADVCVLVEFCVRLREGNPALFEHEWEAGSAEAEAAAALVRFTELCLARCRYLLYALGGPQTVVMSGDDAYVPFVQMQEYAEHAHPDVRVHSEIGMQNAQGLRFARLQSRSSSRLAELLGRLERCAAAPGRPSLTDTHTRTLTKDVVQHLAHKVAKSQMALSLDDVLRVLPVLAELLPAAEARDAGAAAPYARLLSAISATVGAEMRQQHDPRRVVELLRGLALCRFPTSNFAQIEAVLVRLALQRTAAVRRGGGEGGAPTGLTFAEQATAVHSMLTLVGREGVSPVFLLNTLTSLVGYLEKAEGAAAGTEDEVLDMLRLLRVLRFSEMKEFPRILESVLLLLPVPPTAAPPPRESSAVRSLSTGVLSSIAAAAASPADGAAEDSPPDRWRDRAVEELRTGVAALRGGSATSLDADLLLEAVVSCAALGTNPFAEDAGAADVFAAVGGQPRVHTLATPRFAAIVLQSLGDLGLVERARGFYEAHARFLCSAMAALPTGAALPAADRAVLLHGLRLGGDVTLGAARRLVAELMALEAAAVGGVSSEDNRAASFEQAAIQQGNSRREVEDAIAQIREAFREHPSTRALLDELYSHN